MSDITNNNPGLANELAANGAEPGYPQTLELSVESPGYEKGDSTLVVKNGVPRPAPWNQDARGLPRIDGDVSIGAEDPDAQ